MTDEVCAKCSRFSKCDEHRQSTPAERVQAFLDETPGYQAYTTLKGTAYMLTTEDLRALLKEQELAQWKIAASKHRAERERKKAVKANLELIRVKQENARLKMENRIQHGWLNAENSYTRRYNALEARVNIIRDVLSESFPEKYGEPGTYNWFGTRDQ